MSTTDQSAAARRLAEVRENITRAAKTADRDASDITLIAVSKTHPRGKITPVIAAGQTDFGENRVQEAQEKWPEIRDAHQGLKLHLLGPLQSNKVRDAVELFDVFHALDRPKIARAIARHGEEVGRLPQCFIQVNIGEEKQKSGILPEETDDFVKQMRDEFGLPLLGLMCIPPLEEEPAPYFALLRKLANRNGLDGLSMGMSGDYELAVEMGATHVRVGTAIFGPRGT